MLNFSKIAAFSLVAATSVPALASGEMISKIDATVDLSAVQNEQAAGFWANLEADLENAIAQRLGDRLVLDDDAIVEGAGPVPGLQILVDIREVELASAFERELNLGDAVLVGQVNIKDQTNNSNFNAYELSVSLETAKIIVPDGTTIILSADMTDTYQNLVDTFADGVVARLD